MSVAAPTPWVAEPKGFRGGLIKGADGAWSCLSCGDDDGQADANAALIIRAVNSHDILVDALKRLVDAASAYEPESNETGAEFWGAIVNAAHTLQRVSP